MDDSKMPRIRRKEDLPDVMTMRFVKDANSNPHYQH